MFLRPFLRIRSNPFSKIIGMDSRNSRKLAEQLRLYRPPPPDPVVIERMITEKKAAVLICLFEGDEDGEIRVILTKRSSTLSTHSGEVSLPGGKAEEADSGDADTATREAKEEIGLDPNAVDIVAYLEPFLSKHLLRVVPVIGILHNRNDFTPAPCSDEVEDVFDAPLEMFLKDENRRSLETEWLGEKYLIHFFDYRWNDKEYVIWGLTAAILIKAASVVYQRSPPFPVLKKEIRPPTHRRSPV